MVYTSDKIRRLFIYDNQWIRTSDSWKSIEPHKNFNCIDLNDESISDYCKRIKEIVSVPEVVADQWLYNLYYNGNTVDNYGWINYSTVCFEKIELEISKTIELKVIGGFSSYVREVSESKPFNQFNCTPIDKQYWQQHLTWRTPPVVVDVSSFPKAPQYADFSGALQLIEGHTRLGYLLAMYKSNIKLPNYHTVYLMKAKNA